MSRLAKILKSKTFWAGIVGAAGIVVSAPVLTLPVLLKAGSVVLGAIGVKDGLIKVEDKVENPNTFSE